MKAGYLFPGQGSQALGVGEDFFSASTLAKEMFEEASEAIKTDFKKLLFEPNDKLNETEFSQPAILLVSAISHKLLGDVFPSSLSLGHSLGELTALYSVGALDFADAIKLVHERGLLMKKACARKDAGMMAVIGIDQDKLKTLVDGFLAEKKEIYLANINNQSQIVLAGKKQDLSSVQGVLKENGAKRALLLPMSVASHCPILSSAVEPFGKLLEQSVRDEFKTPIISNVTAKPYDDKKSACELLCSQLTSPVEYVKSIEYAQSKSEIFIEFGGKVLSGLNKRITKKPTYSITDMKSLEILANLQKGTA